MQSFALIEMNIDILAITLHAFFDKFAIPAIDR